MKYSVASIAAFVTVSTAVPMAQFGGGFSIPSFSFPSSGFTIPSSPGLPGATKTPSVGGSLPTSVEATATSVVPAAPSSSTGGGTIGGNCISQGSGGGQTEDGVKNKNCCTDVTVIFARGTGELGNMGTISGPPMVKSLRAKLGTDRVTVQGVAYAASTAGNANLGADGGKLLAELVNQALTQCPSTKIVVSGYSQGAMVVHNAFSAQGLKSSQVACAVQFGDPLIRQSVGDLPTDKVKEFCGSSDTVCGSPTGDVTGGHLSYGEVADKAADFIISAAGLA